MSVYRKPKKLPLRKRSRTKPIYGTGDDEGKYYRCWNCGFVCDASRDKLGDGEAGDNHTASSTGDSLYLAGVRPYGKRSHLYVGLEDQCCLGGPIGHYHTAMRLRAEGSTYVENVVHDLKSNVTHGCPFCGTTNWRGDN